jgi:hypothetical protein
MSDTSRILGKMVMLQAKKVNNELGRALYFSIVKQKDYLVSHGHFDEDPFHMYETLEQAKKTSKKGETRPTYKGDRKVKDNDTGIVIVEENVDVPLKKFTTVTAEAKCILHYLLQAYMTEVKGYYDSHNFTFPEEKALMTELVKYSQLNVANPVTPFIYHSAENFQIDSIMRGTPNDMSSTIKENCKTYFKNKDDYIPDAKLVLVTDTFVRFINVLSVMIADVIFERRQATNLVFIFGLMRILSSLTHAQDAGLNQEVLDNIKEYVKINKPKKEEKDDTGSDVEEPKKKKKSTKKNTPAEDESEPATNKKKRGRPKTSPESLNPNEDEGNLDDANSPLKGIEANKWEENDDAINDD